MQRPVTDLTEHLKRYNDAVLIVGSKALQRVLPEEQQEDPDFIKKEPLFFQPGENSMNIFSRKTMIKNPNMFWKFYDQIIMKNPEESTNTYNKIKELIDMNLIKSVIDFNTDGTLSNIKSEYTPMRGNRNVLQCVKCKETFYVPDINLDVDKPILCCDLNGGSCKGKVKPTIPFYGEKYSTEDTSKIFHDIFTYDEEDKPTGLNTHTLILIGPNFTEDLLDEIITGFNQFRPQQPDTFSVFITDNDDLFMNDYAADFGTTYDIEESLTKLINTLKE